MQSRLGPKLLPLLIGLFIGGVFAIIGVMMLRDSVNSVAHMSRGRGQVIDMVVHSGSKGSTYAPVIEYVADNGDTYRFTSDIYSSPPSHQVGDQVDVLYDPVHPIDARENAFLTLWLFPLVFGLPGMLIVIIVLVVAVRTLMQ
jgi:Protein of unknown function (DUF3592)